MNKYILNPFTCYVGYIKNLDTHSLCDIDNNISYNNEITTNNCIKLQNNITMTANCIKLYYVTNRSTLYYSQYDINFKECQILKKFIHAIILGYNIDKQIKINSVKYSGKVSKNSHVKMIKLDSDDTLDSNISITISPKLDINKYYVFFMIGKSDKKNCSFIDDHIYNQSLKGELTFFSDVHKGNVTKYGVMMDNKLNNCFYIFKMLHYEFNHQFKFNYPSQEYDVIIIIAFTGRYHVLEENIKLLRKQNNIHYSCGIVLVGSSDEDMEFSNNISVNEHVYYCQCSNNPIGLKWQTGVYYSRLFNPKSIMILGSDDILSVNYIDKFYSLINRYDFIGIMKWYIINNDDINLYKLEYTNNVDIPLGSGRMYSRNILDKCDWNIFEIFRNCGLDSYGYLTAKKLSDNILIYEEDDISLLSIKGNWSHINSFNKIYESDKIIIKKYDSSKLNDYFKNIHKLYDIANLSTIEQLLYDLPKK